MPSGSGGGPAALPGAGSAWGPCRRSEFDGEAKSGLAACSPECQGSGEVSRDTPQPQACPAVQVPSAAGSQAVAAQVGSCLLCKVIFSFVFSASFLSLLRAYLWDFHLFFQHLLCCAVICSSLFASCQP